MLPRYNEINYKKSIKKRLVRLKLNGSLDSYEELNNQPEFKNLTIEQLKKLGKNIKQIVIKKLEITETEFNDFETRKLFAMFKNKTYSMLPENLTKVIVNIFFVQAYTNQFL